MPESLATITEFAIGLAGFSGIIVALGEHPGRMHPVDRFRVMTMLATALGVALFSVVPVSLADTGYGAHATWRVSGSVYGLFNAIVLAWVLRHRTRLTAQDLEHLHPAMWVIGVGGFVFSTLLLWSVALAPSPTPGPYLAALVFNLFYASLLFVRVLFVSPGRRVS